MKKRFRTRCIPTCVGKTVFILISDHFMHLSCLLCIIFTFKCLCKILEMEFVKWNSPKYIHRFYISTFASETGNTDVFNLIPKTNIYERMLESNLR